MRCEIRERVGYDYLEAASAKDGMHTESEVIRQCLLADGVARKASSWKAASVMCLCVSEICQGSD